nr:annexin [Hymenolepis microstoma]CUU97329.1 annexin [Hymenolepis microstoma]
MWPKGDGKVSKSTILENRYNSTCGFWVCQNTGTGFENLPLFIGGNNNHLEVKKFILNRLDFAKYCEIGTAESTIIRILCESRFEQIELIDKFYHAIAGHDLVTVIEKEELSGMLERRRSLLPCNSLAKSGGSYEPGESATGVTGFSRA